MPPRVITHAAGCACSLPSLSTCPLRPAHLTVQTNRLIVLFLTFLCYTAYHASRKPPSIVKSVLHGDASNGALPAASLRPCRCRCSGAASKHSKLGTCFAGRLQLRLHAATSLPMQQQQIAWLAAAPPLSCCAAACSLLLPCLPRCLSPSPPAACLRRPPAEVGLDDSWAGDVGKGGGGWAPFNHQRDGKALLGQLDLAFLGAYACEPGPAVQVNTSTSAVPSLAMRRLPAGAGWLAAWVSCWPALPLGRWLEGSMGLLLAGAYTLPVPLVLMLSACLSAGVCALSPLACSRHVCERPPG